MLDEYNIKNTYRNSHDPKQGRGMLIFKTVLLVTKAYLVTLKDILAT